MSRESDELLMDAVCCGSWLVSANNICAASHLLTTKRARAHDTCEGPAITATEAGKRSLVMKRLIRRNNDPDGSEFVRRDPPATIR